MSHRMLRFAIASLLPAALAMTMLASCRPRAASLPAVRAAVAEYGGFLDTLQHRTFLYFWELGDTTRGLTPDRWPTPSFVSTGAMGFALTAYPIGAEHGWVSRAAARAQMPAACAAPQVRR